MPEPPAAAPRSFISPIDAMPGVADALRAFKAGERGPAEQLYHGSRDSGFRYAFAKQLAEAAPRVTSVATPFDADVERDALWRSVRGCYHTRVGWDARGGGTGDTVTEEGANVLFIRCEKAINDLEEAGRMDPADDVPFVLMMQAARGLSDTDLGETAYHQATQRNANSWGAAFQRVEWLSPRWFGDVEKLLDYARAESKRVGNGELAAVPILAHIDLNLYYTAFLKDREKAAAARQAAAAEVRDCLARSVDAPGAQRLFSTPLIRHYGGSLLWQVADEDGAKAQLSKVGNVYEGWCWLQNQKAYENVRQRLALD
jgi:hypothetical protein